MHKGSWLVQIIDDEVVILLAVSRAYRDKSVDIVTASNIDQALAQMDIFNFDLFLLDLDMKDRCSYVLLKIMTDRYPDIPVILMTTGDIESGELIKKIEGIRSFGCWHLLEKPFDYQKLVGFINRGLQEYSSAAGVSPIAEPHEKRRCQRFSRFEQINLALPSVVNETCQTTPFLATLVDVSVGGLGLSSKKKLVVPQLIHFDEKFMHQSGVVIWSRLQKDQMYRSGILFS